MPVNINGTTGVTTPALASTAMPTSGGDPVVESGSNTDGEWTRWAEGTQICVKSNASALTCTNNPSGDYWTTNVVSLTFPAAFLSIPTPLAGANNGASAFGFSQSFNSITATSMDSRGYGVNSSQTVKAGNYSAIGRWK